MRLILLMAVLLVAVGCGENKPPTPTPEPALGTPPKTPKGGPPVLPQ